MPSESTRRRYRKVSLQTLRACDGCNHLKLSLGVGGDFVGPRSCAVVDGRGIRCLRLAELRRTGGFAGLMVLRIHGASIMARDLVAVIRRTPPPPAAMRLTVLSPAQPGRRSISGNPGQPWSGRWSCCTGMSIN